MSSRKRNEWLEADLEDEELLEESDAQEESRDQKFTSRSSKRRRIDSNLVSGSEDSDLDDEDDDDESRSNLRKPDEESHLTNNEHLVTEPDMEKKSEKQRKSEIERKLAKTQNASSRSGVVYISQIPPFMKPHTLKNLFSPFAPSGLGRIYLTPEDQERRQARVRAGGNKKRNFVDGWVEFISKKEAKAVVDTLNTRTIGGKKGGYYFDDVWNLKYLKGFKWRHLTEQIANENEERAARMRAEASKSKREMREFLLNVERARIEEKNAARFRLDEKEAETVTQPVTETVTKRKMGFNQSVPIISQKKKPHKDDDELKDHVLSQIF